MTDDTTTVLPSNTTPGYFHSGGGNHGRSELLGELLLSERVSNAASFNGAAIDRVGLSAKEDAKDFFISLGDIRRELSREIGEVKHILVEKTHQTNELIRSTENSRLRDDLAIARTQLVALQASGAAG